MLTLKELTDQLHNHSLNLTEWGADGAKNIADLHQELISGDAQLQLNPLLRLVQVVNVRIQRGNKILVEVEQELIDGQRRQRNIPPAEKMKPDESAAEAAIRCVQEELGVAAHDVKISFVSQSPDITIRSSPSYPGLQTQYTIHTVVLAIKSGLPLTDFWRENQAAGSGDPVKRHRWAWQSAK